MSVVKVIRIVGSSPESWARAAAEAAREAGRTIRNIQGVEATDFTAKVDESGEIVEYRCTVNIAFLVGRGGGEEGDEGARGGGRSGGGAPGGRSGGGASGGRSGGSRGSDRGGGGRGGGKR